MATILRHIQILAVVPVAALLAQDTAPRFYPDDPIRREPRPAPVGEVRPNRVDALYDLVRQSSRPKQRPAQPARNVNTLDEAPDSAWYTNRHGFRRMSREELQRGAGNENAPAAPLTITGAKTDGITAGFKIRDARGRLYFVKADPASNPEMATAADMIGSRFFHALGYNTPENYLVRVKPSELVIGPEATTTGISGRPRRLEPRDLDAILGSAAREKDGSVRLLASLALKGRPLGPFKYEGVRADDPNDAIPHEERRELRALYVFAAWLNHTDAKAQNTLDTVVEENGVRYVKHHLIDFGATLGSASDMAKPARTGNGYLLPTPRELLLRMATFGLYSEDWESARYPNLKAAGRFEAERFDPEQWKSNYPNPAFLSRRADDEFWAARQVMAFTDDDIRAIVETGEYSDPRVTEHIVRTLAGRRDKIGRAYLNKVVPLDRFRVEENELRFEDLAVKYGFAQPQAWMVSWTRFDNRTRDHSRLSGESFALPGEWRDAAEGAYLAAHIDAGGADERRVTVYVRKTNQGGEVVGIDRHIPSGDLQTAGLRTEELR